jgi:hypothetical protein
VAYPNPSHGEPVFFNLEGGPYDDVCLKLYSQSFRPICHITYPCRGEREMKLTWDLKDQSRVCVANGVYLAVIETECNGKKNKYTNKVLLLK